MAGELHVTTDGLLTPLNMRVVQDNRYSLPGIKAYTEQIPGRDGELFFGSKWQPRAIELSLVSDDEFTFAQREAKAREIAALLAGDSTLIFDNYSDRCYTVRLAGGIQFQRYRTSFQFTVTFRTLSPYAESTLNSATGGSTLTNAGNVETPMSIEITGSGVVPPQTLTVAGVAIKYTAVIPSGKKVIIDTEKLTVTQDGVSKLPSYIGGFPKLKPGSNTVANTNAAFTFRWKSRWV